MKYVYRIEAIGYSTGDLAGSQAKRDAVQAAMNAAGRDGWKLVEVREADGKLLLFFVGELGGS